MNSETMRQEKRSGGVLIWIIIVIVAALIIWWWMSNRAVAPSLPVTNDTTSAINEDLTAINLETIDFSEIDKDINTL